MLDLNHIFKYHAPTTEQVGQYNRLREAARRFAEVVLEETPASADQSTAIRKIREAVMIANAAIALSATEDAAVIYGPRTGGPCAD